MQSPRQYNLLPTYRAQYTNISPTRGPHISLAANLTLLSQLPTLAARKTFSRRFAHPVIQIYQGSHGPALEGRMQLIPLWDKGQMRRESQPKLPVIRYHKCGIKRGDKRWKKREAGCWGLLIHGRVCVVSSQMVQSGPAPPDPSDSCTRSSAVEVSVDLLPSSEYIMSFQWKRWPCVSYCVYVCVCVCARAVRSCKAGSMTGGIGE